MDESLARLAEVADLEPARCSWPGTRRCACRPPASRGTASSSRRRSRDDIDVDAVRVARRDFDKASRVPDELIG